MMENSFELYEMCMTVRIRICYSYTMVLGIYGSKPTEPEGKVVYVAINP